MTAAFARDDRGAVDGIGSEFARPSQYVRAALRCGPLLSLNYAGVDVV
jgi:hypothetical protein